MLIGAHAIIYSTSVEEDRAFLRDVLKLPHVDVGDGWLIFGLPPAEIAVHPSSENDVHELYLMVDDIEGFITSLKDREIPCGAVQNQGWGLLTEVTLPGGGKLGVYQPRHARPEPMTGEKPVRRAARLAANEPAANEPAADEPAAETKKPVVAPPKKPAATSKKNGAPAPAKKAPAPAKKAPAPTRKAPAKKAAPRPPSKGRR